MSQRKKILWVISLICLVGIIYGLVSYLSVDKSPVEVEKEIYVKVYEEMEISKLDNYEYPKKEEDYHKKLKEIEQGKRLEGYDPNEFLDIQVDESLAMDGKEYKKYFKDIRLDDMLNEDGIVYIGRKTCPYCNILVQRFTPVLTHLGLEIRYIDTDKLNDIGIEKLSEEYGLEYVPTVYLVKDGKVERVLDGRTMYMSYDDIARQLVASMDYILGDGEKLPLSSEVIK